MPYLCETLFLSAEATLRASSLLPHTAGGVLSLIRVKQPSDLIEALSSWCYETNKNIDLDSAGLSSAFTSFTVMDDNILPW